MTSGALSDEFMERVLAEMQTPAAIADAERAPTPPAPAIELLRANGFPFRRTSTEQAA